MLFFENGSFNIAKQEAINDYLGLMLRQNQVKGSKLSRLVMSVMILLSLLAFLGSASANTNSRKPVNRETLTLRKITAKRNISLQRARQHLLFIDFFRNAAQVSMRYSLPQHERLWRTELRGLRTKKSLPPEIQKVILLHAPRSTDEIIPSRG